MQTMRNKFRLNGYDWSRLSPFWTMRVQQTEAHMEIIGYLDMYSNFTKKTEKRQPKIIQKKTSFRSLNNWQTNSGLNDSMTQYKQQ